MQDARALIDPRADTRLEELHSGSDDVEQDDDPQLPERLQAKNHHQHLDDDGGDRDEVVSGEKRVIRVPEPGREQHGKHRGAEDAGPGLLEREHDELDDALPQPALRGAREKTMGTIVDEPLERGEATLPRRFVHAAKASFPAERS